MSDASTRPSSGAAHQGERINNRDKLLSFLDDEIIDARLPLSESGVLIRHSEEYERVEAPRRLRVHLKSNTVIQATFSLGPGRTGN